MINRYLAISHFVDGKSRTVIAKYLKVARGIVIYWVQLSNFIKENRTLRNSGCLQAKDIQFYITVHFEIDYKMSSIYRLLHRLNLS